jgi:hypothetical protein
MRAYGLKDLGTTLQWINGKFRSTVCELYVSTVWCRGVGLSANADKTSMVLFTNNKNLVGFKKPILFGTELQLKNQLKLCMWELS